MIAALNFALGPVTFIMFGAAVALCTYLLWPNRLPEPAPADDSGGGQPKISQDQQPDPPVPEKIVGPYLVLRVTNPMRPVTSVLYPMLRGDLEPVLWPGEAIERHGETIDDLGRRLDDDRKRTDAHGRVLLTNRRLIAWSHDKPLGAQRWQHTPDSRGRALVTPGSRLMAHILWEWVMEIRITVPTEHGLTVEVVMDATECGYTTASLLLTFGHSADAAEQRARVFASNVNSWLNKNGVDSRQDGNSYIMSRHTPVGRVSWWES